MLDAKCGVVLLEEFMYTYCVRREGECGGKCNLRGCQEYLCRCRDGPICGVYMWLHELCYS